MRVIVLSLSPFIHDPWAVSAEKLFDLTGGNTGNMAFQFAVLQHIASENRVLPLGASPETIRASGDIIVMPLANQLGPHTDLGSLADTLEKAQLPVIGIGLGAQAAKEDDDISLTAGTEKWVRTIASLSPGKGPNLGVRGEYTWRLLEKLGLGARAAVMGCPSNFIAPDEGFLASIAGKLSKPLGRIAVTAGIPFLPKLAAIEQDLADLVTATHGLYIVQHGLDMVRIGRGEFNTMTEEAFELARAYIRPALPDEAFKIWCRNYARAFTDVRFWMDELSRHDFAVGTRFHGAMLSIQAGTPAGCISHDSRVHEMCQTMKIPVIKYTEIGSGITRSRLKDLFQFEAGEYLNERKKLGKRYIGILESAGISASARLLNAVG